MMGMGVSVSGVRVRNRPCGARPCTGWARPRPAVTARASKHRQCLRVEIIPLVQIHVGKRVHGPGAICHGKPHRGASSRSGTDGAAAGGTRCLAPRGDGSMRCGVRGRSGARRTGPGPDGVPDGWRHAANRRRGKTWGRAAHPGRVRLSCCPAYCAAYGAQYGAAHCAARQVHARHEAAQTHGGHRPQYSRTALSKSQVRRISITS
jgi:hypothetical protein